MMVNPYEPSASHLHSSAPGPKTSNLILFGLSNAALVLAAFVLLLLTQRIFAQSVAFLLCIATSAACWLVISLQCSQRWRGYARVVAALHFLAIVGAGATLSSRYRLQKMQQEAVQRMKEQASTRP